MVTAKINKDLYSWVPSLFAILCNTNTQYNNHLILLNKQVWTLLLFYSPCPAIQSKTV